MSRSQAVRYSARRGQARLPGFSSQEAADYAGITYRQLDFWTRQGWVAPSIGPAEGSGSSRRWSQVDLWALRDLAETIASMDEAYSEIKSGAAWRQLTEKEATHG